jgi:hypothetical protein
MSRIDPDEQRLIEQCQGGLIRARFPSGAFRIRGFCKKPDMCWNEARCYLVTTVERANQGHQYPLPPVA